jgi:hypothetical protein
MEQLRSDSQKLTAAVANSITLDMVYPVGSIYMSINEVDPSVLFGGKWERIQEKFLLAASDSYSSGSTGGSYAHSHDKGNMVAAIGCGNGNPNSMGFVADNTHG